MPATTGTQLSADQGGEPATVGGGITRLNPSDGLFLRAQHLAAMEDYALELSQAVGIAAGTGVVFGYHVSLDREMLTVEPGLAIGPHGRPLRSGFAAKLDISGLKVTGDEFYVVEVAAAGWNFGQENMYGNLCTDPCSQGVVIQPYRAEGITIGTRKDTMPGLSVAPNPRNFLASGYYERERERGVPWLVPSASGTPVQPLSNRKFSSATGAPDGDAVPLAALFKPDGGWQLDVWIARRDLGDPAPRRAWQAHLAMRPWDVFIAQVLQFQAQFAEEYQAAYQARPATSGTAEEITKALAGIREGLGRQYIKANWLTTGVTAIEKAVGELEGKSQTSLRDQGFDELPPAGYLPAPPANTGIASYAVSLFGTAVDLRICHCRADEAVRAVEQAQHLDRIPLDPAAQLGTPGVDVLVPSHRADLAPLYADSYPWVAFIRRSEPDCERAADHVAVYLIDAGEDAGHVAERIIHGYLPEEHHRAARLRYPPGAYAVPAPHDVYDVVHEWLRKDREGWAIGIGIASAQDRQPLAAARTFLLALKPEASGRLDEVDILAGCVAGRSPEIIAFVRGTRNRHDESDR